MGDAVNVAARLKDLTPPGSVYTGPEIYEQTHEEFEYRPLEPLKVKGKEEPVAIFELIRERAPG
jgi:adenylate cyclase